jgi:hypothetical protein
MELYLRSPSNIQQLKDTVIDKTVYNHFLVTLLDTIQKNERVHDLVNIVTDKTTFLPFIVRTDFKGFSDDGALIGAVEEHRFEDYHKNEKSFPDLSAAKVPEGFTLPVKAAALPPLALGTIAPRVSLQDAPVNPLIWSS